MNRTFVNILFNFDIITEDDLLKLIADNLGTEVFIFKNKELDMNLVNTVPADMARFYGVIPVKEEGDVLWLVAKDPLSSQLTDELPFALGRDCRIMVGYPREIDEMLDVFYPEKSSTVKDIIEEMSSLRTDISGDDAESLEKAANEAPIVRFVNLILQQAIKDKASDIHFEPFSDEFRIRYRIDGSLYEMAPPPKHLAIPVISRIKVMSNLNIAERRIPQDGRIELRINKKPIDLRVSTLPTRYGESVVLRVLDRSVVNLSLDSLGMTEKTIADIRRLIALPKVASLSRADGPPARTTTLYSGLRKSILLRTNC